MRYETKKAHYLEYELDAYKEKNLMGNEFCYYSAFHILNGWEFLSGHSDDEVIDMIEYMKEEINRFENWKNQFIKIALSDDIAPFSSGAKYSDWYSQIMIDTMDWSAYKEYFDDDLTSQEAVDADVDAMISSL